MRKRKAKPKKARKYFGKPSVLMVNTIIHAAIRVLRRERRRLRKLLAEEYSDLEVLRKKYPTEIQELLTGIETETECLKNGIMVEEREL